MKFPKTGMVSLDDVPSGRGKPHISENAPPRTRPVRPAPRGESGKSSPSPGSRADPSSTKKAVLRRSLEQALACRDVEAVIHLACTCYKDDLRLYLLSKGVNENDVEDLLQNVFSLILIKFDSFTNVNFRGWLFTFARYEYLSWRYDCTSNKRLTSDPRHKANLSPVSEDSINTLLDSRFLTSQAMELMREENDINAEIFRAVFLEGCDSTETIERIRELLNVSLTPGSFGKRKIRLRDKLASRLQTLLRDSPCPSQK